MTDNSISLWYSSRNRIDAPADRQPYTYTNSRTNAYNPAAILPAFFGFAAPASQGIAEATWLSAALRLAALFAVPSEMPGLRANNKVREAEKANAAAKLAAKAEQEGADLARLTEQ